MLKRKYDRVVVKSPKTRGKNAVCVQGRKAAVNGRSIELLVEDIFESLGFITAQWSARAAVDPEVDKNVLYKNVPYTSMYGCKSRGDFYIVSDRFKNPIRLEVRSQRVSGSVDEKLPYLFFNCMAVDEKDVIVVLEGDGFKKGAKEWFKKQAKSVVHKNIYTVDMASLKTWAERTFK